MLFISSSYRSADSSQASGSKIGSPPGQASGSKIGSPPGQASGSKIGSPPGQALKQTLLQKSGITSLDVRYYTTEEQLLMEFIQFVRR